MLFWWIGGMSENIWQKNLVGFQPNIWRMNKLTPCTSKRNLWKKLKNFQFSTVSTFNNRSKYIKMWLSTKTYNFQNVVSGFHKYYFLGFPSKQNHFSLVNLNIQQSYKYLKCDCLQVLQQDFGSGFRKKNIF